MRQESLETRKQQTFPRELIEATRQRLEKGEQIYPYCSTGAGFRVSLPAAPAASACKCINCSLTLTYHKRDRRLLCHYCSYAEKVPSICPKCQ